MVHIAGDSSGSGVVFVSKNDNGEDRNSPLEPQSSWLTPWMLHLAMTWWWMPASRLNGQRNPPTSREDSLVVVDAGVGVGWRKETTNESSGLVGGGGCWRPRWKAKGTHHRVVKTRWWWWMPVLGVADAGVLAGKPK